eukprot:TRINITY_DN67840_c6_g3_i1.p1 TRINITY_DN67840_c6_g3~~TRINITY_DN67840_c6_g3_i1.p1  ORF type:complete len:113 (-),score=3.33 TRINITY_DN67840_c6_g3_i1:762-1100(-)
MPGNQNLSWKPLLFLSGVPTHSLFVTTLFVFKMRTSYQTKGAGGPLLDASLHPQWKKEREKKTTPVWWCWFRLLDGCKQSADKLMTYDLWPGSVTTVFAFKMRTGSRSQTKG